MSGAGSPFSATVDVDPELETPVVHLAYEDRSDPSRRITVGIAPELGSNMFRFRVGAHEVIYCEPELLKARDFTGNFVLWPLPNRVRDKKYVYQGRTYSLADVKRPRGNDVLIHGLVFDRPWQYDPPVVSAESASVTTHVDMTPDAPYFESYPFESRLSLTYTLAQDSLTVTYRVENRGDKDLPFGFALHPYFSALSGGDGTLVSIPATRVMEADDELLPTGRILNVDSVMYAMFDLRRPVPLDTLNLDHVYTGLLPGQEATITYRDQAMTLRFATSDDFTHVVLYAPPDTPYFCLEHQTCSTDAANLHAQGRQDIAHLLELAPGDARTGFIRYMVEHT